MTPAPRPAKPTWYGQARPLVCAYCRREFDHILGKPGRPRTFCSPEHQREAERLARRQVAR